jgi:hypothetical protein
VGWDRFIKSKPVEDGQARAPAFAMGGCSRSGLQSPPIPHTQKAQAAEPFTRRFKQSHHAKGLACWAIYGKVNLPLLDVPLSWSIMRPS